jgi:hypothetical protein
MFQRGFFLSQALLVLASIAHAATVPTLNRRQGSSLGSSPPPEDWQKYVRFPSSQVVSPVAVVANQTSGFVTNPDGLLTSGGQTNLTRTTEQGPPTIVVDFGQNVVGFLSIEFGDGAFNYTPGLPGIRLAFSESLAYGYLTDTSDFSRSDNVVFGNPLFYFL